MSKKKLTKFSRSHKKLKKAIEKHKRKREERRKGIISKAKKSYIEKIIDGMKEIRK